MLSTGLELLIASLVAATFGFGGVGTPFAMAARALSLALFAGFLYCLLMTLLETRNTAARKTQHRHRSGFHRRPLAL